MSLVHSKVPAVVASSLISLVVGVGAGVAAMTVLGYHWSPQPEAAPSSGPPPGMGGPPGGMAGSSGPPGGMMGGMGGMGGMMGGMGGRGPNSKNQLATLVAKLDQLTARPLAVHLSADQKKKVSEQLKGLGNAEELKEDDAKQRLDALLDLLKDQRETLEAAGYRWPGQRGGGFRPPADTPNPFKDGDNRKHLQSLELQMTGAQTG